MVVDNNTLAIQRTKLANQRTYLAYMRTGFGIASIAGSFQKIWIAAFGIVMIVGSLLQYVMINKKLNTKEDPTHELLDAFPIIYVLLSVGALYLQWNKNKL